MVTVILLFWSVSHEYLQVHYPECGPLWRLGDNFIMESVLSTIGSGNQTPGLHGTHFTCWTILGPFGVIVVKGFSCISGAKFSVRWHHGMNKDHFREWAHSKPTSGKKGMNSGSAQVYLSAVSDGDCMVALQSGSWGCSCVQSPLPSLRNNEARFLLSDIHSASLLVEY